MTFELYRMLMLLGVGVIFAGIIVACIRGCRQQLGAAICIAGIVYVLLVLALSPPIGVLYHNSVTKFTKAIPPCMMRDGHRLPVDSIPDTCLPEYVEYRLDSATAARRLTEWTHRKFGIDAGCNH